MRQQGVREFDVWLASDQVPGKAKFQAAMEFMMSSRAYAASFHNFVVLEGKYRL